MIYSAVTSPGGYQGGGGFRGIFKLNYRFLKPFLGGSGFDDHGHPPGPPPPGWFRRPPTAPPSYDESMGFGKTSGPSSSTHTGTSSGPGFFTGLGLGALGGYLWGNRYAF